jgi:hypothetical protein
VSFLHLQGHIDSADASTFSSRLQKGQSVLSQ